MSGITGLFHRDARPVDRADLSRMNEAIAHRGPDASDAWSDGAVGLGHVMLWTTPESLKEKLPLVSHSGDLVITADARIDNREELISSLDLNGRPRENISDSELILLAYERWGERCPEKLIGDFAFAIWDKRKEVLFCARDRMGMRPFYYYRSGQDFVFGSEIKALLCLPQVPGRLNETRIGDYLLDLYEDTTMTFYRDVLRLPPAHCLTVNREGARIGSYWSVDTSRQLKLGSDEEYAEAYREVFTEAVRCRLRSAFPVFSTLSGGLDSSSISGVARELLAGGDRGLHTASIVYKDMPEIDESPYIDAVLAGGDLTPHYVYGDQISPMTDIDRMLYHQDEPFAGANMFLHWALSRTTQEEGGRTLLDGMYGDATVSLGLGLLPELVRGGRWLALRREIRQIARAAQMSPYTLLWERAVKPAVPEAVRRGWRWLRYRNGHWVPPDHINPEFARRIGLAERFMDLVGHNPRVPRSSREEHHSYFATGLLPYTLEVGDRVAQAFSIDWRCPFLDFRLVELCLALPGDQKLHDGVNRVVARRALAGVLPEKVCWRRDKGRFEPNLVRGLSTTDLPLLKELVVKDADRLQDYLNVASLRDTYQRFVSEPNHGDGWSLFRAATLAQWLDSTGLTPTPQGREVSL